MSIKPHNAIAVNLSPHLKKLPPDYPPVGVPCRLSPSGMILSEKGDRQWCNICYNHQVVSTRTSKSSGVCGEIPLQIGAWVED
ncbi:hypothetical protein L1F28_05895 [Arthrospira platensis NCB002]|uniref:hypothetical protein n=1 Tax=Limnospira platensis TaxID=118562 RepID=UPI0002F76E73|nr:hypothetical protein [Arthrospira platensis NCB002]